MTKFLVLWVALTVATGLWNLTTIKRALTQENRDRRWREQKSRFVFNEDTGEYERIRRKGTMPGRVLVATASRSKRIVKEEESYRRRRNSTFWLYPLVCASTSLLLTAVLFGHVGTGGFFFLALFLGLPALAFPTLIRGPLRFAQAKTRELVIDPPTRERVKDTFGPATVAEVSTPRPISAVDLTYRPTE